MYSVSFSVWIPAFAGMTKGSGFHPIKKIPLQFKKLKREQGQPIVIRSFDKLRTPQ
jgi:hypothetical protein